MSSWTSTDDVIYPFCEGIEAVLAREGIEGKITQWEAHKDFNMESGEFWDLVYQPKHHDELFLRAIPAETLRHLRRLRYAGNRLHIVTARTRPAAVNACREVMLLWNVPCDTLTFEEDKGAMVDTLNASFSLDDKPGNYGDLNQENHLAFLMDAPHNRLFVEDSNGEHVRRINSIAEFADLVLGFQRLRVQVRGESK